MQSNDYLLKSIAHYTQSAINVLAVRASATSSNAFGQEMGTRAHDFGNELDRLKIWDKEHKAQSGELDLKLEATPSLQIRVLELLEQLFGT